mmetsp:Transcript_37306/g.102976  ORF Transcript_37306/g.102976 Transcript_37306/m.102976 type:complete len:628 (+) Transcript_37306:406-2289(+)
MLKSWSMMGLGVGEGGAITVTDPDTIEKSNLNRQFLFRPWDVSKSKAEAAARAVTAMNPAVKVSPKLDRVGADTEDVFDDAFWDPLSGVCNALDNVQARLYVDQRCVYYQKSLLESGTLGTKCNTQMIVPHLTENYGASRDPPEKEAPQCAVHNFPHNIDQCLVLAHSEYVGNFDTTPQDVNEYLAKGSDWVNQLKLANESDSTILDKLRGDPRVTCGMSAGCFDVLVDGRAAAWDDCVGWARQKFESYFTSRVVQLLHNFPSDAKTSQGVPFWSPPKRLPAPVKFDAADPLHMQFMIAAANLRAFMYGLVPPPNARDPAAIAAVLASSPKCQVAPFTPAIDASIETDNKEEDAKRRAVAAAESEPDDQKIERVLIQLGQAKLTLPQGFTLKANEFEKDDDSNFHMDFISAFGNLRARNYGIEEIEKFQAKLKAGRIIPAIATTTAMATGFVCLELYKQVLARPFGARRNLFANLALPGPLLMLSEPMPCATIKSGQRWDPDMYMDVDEVSYPEGHSLWDKIVVPDAAALTLGRLVDHLAEKHNLALQELSFAKGEKMVAIYSQMLPGFDNASNLPRQMLEIVSTCTGKDASGSLFPLDSVVFKWKPTDDDCTAAKVVLDFTSVPIS